MLFEVLLSVAFPLVIIGLLVWAAVRRKLIRRGPVEDGPLDERYRAYTTEFDVVVDAIDLGNRLLTMSPDYANGYLQLSRNAWNAQIEASEALYREIVQQDGTQVCSDKTFQSTAILLLVDQSGSMKGRPMAWLVNGLRLLTNDLVKAGAAIEVAGFTTAGWHGGFARLKWLANKSPKRPGRLCAVLHIIYKNFEEGEWEKASWQRMLDPNLLRENVDGEALLWASERLSERPEARKLLIIVSDGAPVDDSTLMENGPSYLWKHWCKVVDEIESEGKIDLHAVGINHNVDKIYTHSITLNVGEDFRQAALNFMSR